VVSVFVGLAGIAIAFGAYLYRPGAVSYVYERFQFAHRVLDAKYYVDEAYDLIFVRGSILVGKVWYAIDRAIVDAAVNTVGFASESLGHILKNLQSGDVQRYATYIVLALVLTLYALF
jgi:NADH-quinone oxidoreductase subunit L